jgi:hypothetical protein
MLNVLLGIMDVRWRYQRDIQVGYMAYICLTLSIRLAYIRQTFWHDLSY